jgi:GTP-binding protein
MGRQLKRHSTSKVNAWLQESLKIKAPRVAKRGVEKRYGGKTQTQYLNLTYALQTNVRPMTFQIFCNAPQAVAEEDKKFLEHRLREHFHLLGIPVKLVFRKKV